MAIIRSGVLGNTRGKVAGVVGSQWKDKNYLREYVKPANPDTAAQQAQRARMTDVVAFAKACVGPVFNSYTDKFLKSMSGFNFFIKRNIAVFDGTPAYDEVKLTEGKLYPVAVTDATYEAVPNRVDIDYDADKGNNGAADDAVYAAVYDPETGLWYFAFEETARNTGQIQIGAPSNLSGQNLETYTWAAKYSGSVVSMISSSVHFQEVIA